MACNPPSYCHSTVRPSIRVRSNLLQQNQDADGAKVNESALERDAARMKEEVEALRWLADKKEAEWDRTVRVLKRKEAELAVAEKKQKVAKGEVADKVKDFLQAAGATGVAKIISTTTAPAAVTGPKTIIIKAGSGLLGNLPQYSGSGQAPVAVRVVPRSQLLGNTSASSQNIIAVRPPTSTPSSVTPSAKSILITKGVRPILPKQPVPPNALSSSAGESATDTDVPLCQTCHKAKAQFACSACKRRWYCSTKCQLNDWKKHEDKCKTVGAE